MDAPGFESRAHGTSEAFISQFNSRFDQSPTQVRDEIHRLIDTLAAPFNNAYILGPVEQPYARDAAGDLEALFEACHDQ